LRIPVFKPWRAFEEFDHLSDEECEKHVGDAWANSSPWMARIPYGALIVLLLAWPSGWVLAYEFFSVTKYVPLPRSFEARVVLLAVSTVVVAFFGMFAVRDLALYVLLRKELRRADCPKCGQSLRGLPVQSVGIVPDPTKNTVRCTECGRVHALMDLGLTPRDLVPLEQRRVPPEFAKVRR
jgi:hypothetical protein